MVILGEHPGNRVKIILFRKGLSQHVESFSELIFSSDSVYARYVVNSLMEMHANECLWGDRIISPTDIPICLFWLIDYFHAKQLSDFLYDWILSDCLRGLVHAVEITM